VIIYCLVDVFLQFSTGTIFYQSKKCPEHIVYNIFGPLDKKMNLFATFDGEILEFYLAHVSRMH
jgi:hypothetical protein